MRRNMLDSTLIPWRDWQTCDEDVVIHPLTCPYLHIDSSGRKQWAMATAMVDTVYFSHVCILFCTIQNEVQTTLPYQMQTSKRLRRHLHTRRILCRRGLPRSSLATPENGTMFTCHTYPGTRSN